MSLKTLARLLLALITVCMATPTAIAQTISFDDLLNLPAPSSSSTFGSANGGSDVLFGVTFPDTFAISGDQNVLASDGTPFLIPNSGGFAGFGFGETFITSSLVLQDLYLSGTSLAAENDGVTELTVQASGASGEILGEVLVTGLSTTPVFIDTTAFNALSGIAGYNFQIDSAGADNARFGIDDIRFASVPEPSSGSLIGLCIICSAVKRRRIRCATFN